jgi:hypothetical protein
MLPFISARVPACDRFTNTTGNLRHDRHRLIARAKLTDIAVLLRFASHSHFTGRSQRGRAPRPLR